MEQAAPPPPEQPQAAAAPPVHVSGMDVTPADPQAAYPTAYPVGLDIGYQREYSRFYPLVKWLAAIPHFIALFFVAIGFLVGWVVAFFAVLFTGKYPEGLFNFFLGFLRWSWRVNAYISLMEDKYPPFTLDDDPDYPVRLNIDYPPEGKIARWRVIGNYFLAIPHLIILYFLIIGVFVVQIIAFFAILFTKEFTRGMFDFMANAYRWQARVTSYQLFMTEKYPPFTLG